MEPKTDIMMTREEKPNTLSYLMLFKNRICVRIKGNRCADIRKKCVYKTKEDTRTPTVSIESLFLLCIIDSKENFCVTTIAIKSASMYSDIDEFIQI